MKEEEHVEQKGECVVVCCWDDSLLRTQTCSSLFLLAQRIAKSMSISIVDNIKGCDELFWHKYTYRRKGGKTASAPFPVRICESDKPIGLALKQKWDSNQEELVQYLSHGDLNELSLVPKIRLTHGLVPQTNT
jgi:hypothetical protein